jgi:hypothetical protein
VTDVIESQWVEVALLQLGFLELYDFEVLVVDKGLAGELISAVCVQD